MSEDLVSALERKIAEWREGRKKLLAGVKDSPSHDLKRLINERAEAFEICIDELKALLAVVRAPQEEQFPIDEPTKHDLDQDPGFVFPEGAGVRAPQEKV